MQAQQSCECGICTIPGFERNAYYYGKSMTVRDMVAEQNYFIEKRRLINRSVIGWGVVCGLDVSVHKGRLHVSDGFGIDARGRELLVCDFEGADPLSLIEDCHTGRMTDCGEEWVLCLEYEECKTEKVRTPPSGCCSDSDWEYNRIRESVRLTLRNPDELDLPPQHGDACPLNGIEVRRDVTRWPFDRDDDQVKGKLQQQTVAVQALPQDTPVEEIDAARAREMQIAGKAEVADDFARPRECDPDKPCATQKVDDYLCDELRKGCDDSSPCECVPLGAVIIQRDDNQRCPSVEVKPCKYRRLIYSNHLLSDLIHCYHGDLPRIVDYNWFRAEFPAAPGIGVEQFERLVRAGPIVVFNESMDMSTIHKHSFLFSIIVQDDNTGYMVKRFVPAAAIERVDPDEVGGCFGVRFVPDPRWITDTFEGRSVLKAHGGSAEFVIRGSLIRSKTGKKLDGDANGTQAGDFVSCIEIQARRDAA